MNTLKEDINSLLVGLAIGFSIGIGLLLFFIHPVLVLCLIFCRLVMLLGKKK